jgi:hypothetical protein
MEEEDELDQLEDEIEQLEDFEEEEDVESDDEDNLNAIMIDGDRLAADRRNPAAHDIINIIDRNRAL